MADDDMWDDNAAVSDGDESLDDDWDIDSEEEREKKAQKEKEEQQKKDEAKSIKQKIKEKEEAERLKREARIAELNREKTEAEKAKEQEDAQLSIAMKDMGLDVMPEDTFLAGDTSTIKTVPSSSTSNTDQNIINFMPKTKEDMTKYADMLAEHCWEKYSHKKDFNFLLEQIVRQLLERHDVDQWEVVKKLGNSVSAIGNEKQKEWKKKNTRGGRGKKQNTAKLGGYGKSGGFDDTAAHEDFDDFM